MDLGATVCTPRSPRCDACPVARWCDARASGDPARFPVRAPKRIRPVRFGTAFRLEARGHVLLVRRPPRGLLGGMLALPTSAWTPAPVDWRTEAPVPADWTLRPTVVRHVFSHFELRLSVVAASLAARTHLPGEWWPADRLDEAGLPTLFAKASRA